MRRNYVDATSKNINPPEPETTAFVNRVIADGGKVLDEVKLNNFYKANKAIGKYNSLQFAVSKQFGYKLDGSGNIIKIYDASKNGNDLDISRGEVPEDIENEMFFLKDSHFKNENASFDQVSSFTLNSVINHPDPNTNGANYFVGFGDISFHAGGRGASVTSQCGYLIGTNNFRSINDSFDLEDRDINRLLNYRYSDNKKNILKDGLSIGESLTPTDYTISPVNKITLGTRTDELTTIDADCYVNDVFFYNEYVEDEILLSVNSIQDLPSVYLDNFIPEDADITPNDFEGSVSERIESAISYLKLQGGGVLELGENAIDSSRTWIIDRSIILPSNVTLYLNKSKLKMADGVFDTIIRNEGIIVNEIDPNDRASSLLKNDNIKIIGSGIGNSFIEGADVAYQGINPNIGEELVDWVGDWYGWRTISILMANVDSFEMKGVSISKTKGYAVSLENGCNNFLFDSIKITSDVKNGDGIDIRQGCSNGKIINIYGNVSDDLIALNTWGTGVNRTLPDGNKMYDHQVGGREIEGNGDITDMLIKNIQGHSSTHLMIILSNGRGQITNIKGECILQTGEKTSAHQALSIYTGRGYGVPSLMGDISNIYIDGVVSTGYLHTLEIDAPVKDSVFTNIVQKRTSGEVLKATGETQNVKVNGEYI